MVPLAPPNDEALVQQVQKGNLEAFNMLYERYLPVVYRRVRYTIPDADVEDVTQEVFIAAMKSLKSFRGESRFSTWLRTLTQRQIADYYRQRKSVQADIEIEEEVDEAHEPTLHIGTRQDQSLQDDRIILRQALRQLPERYREVLLLRFSEGLQFNEVGEMMGLNLEATKSLFRRAVAALQKQLEEIGYEG